MNYRKCEICGLKSCRKNGTKRFFMARYPLDVDRCKQWVKVTGNEDLAYIPIEKLHELKFVCGIHFKNRDFKKKKTQLKKSAVPSLRLQSEPLSDDILSNFPYHVFQEEQERNKDITITPSAAPEAGSEIFIVTEENLQKNADVLYEWEIPQVEHTIEVLTSTEEQVPTKVQRNKNIERVQRKKTQEEKKNELTPRKKKLLKKINIYKLKLKEVKKEIKAFNNINSKALKAMILSASRNQNRCAQGKRWTNNEKALAIAMFKKSPKLYRYLRQLLPLPSARTIQRILSEMTINTGFNKIVLDHLKKKASEMNIQEKTCVIMFDEMSLKKRLIYNSANDVVEGYVDLGEHGRTADLADKALVLLVQGVFKKIKQPLAHYFVSKTISSEKLLVIIKNAIQILSELGFTVIATVCDQGPTNVGAINLLKKFSGQPMDSNYFVLNDNKVFIIYDIPHLLKSIRNNFFEGGEIVFNGKVGKWSHLIEIMDNNREVLRFKKISDFHVRPTFRAKMKVKLASQILSNHVASILRLYAAKFQNETEADGKLKHASILETADVIEEMDKLFDVTNGPASKKDVKREYEKMCQKTVSITNYGLNLKIK